MLDLPPTPPSIGRDQASDPPSEILETNRIGTKFSSLPGRRILAPRKKNIKLVQRRAGPYVQYCTKRMGPRPRR
jgi:hypothetical protein